METKVDLTTEFDELVFENRHKDYGAYQIRKQYKRNVFLAGLLSISILFSGLVLYIISIPEAMAAPRMLHETSYDITRVIPKTVDPPKTKVDPPKLNPPPVGHDTKEMTNPRITDKPVVTNPNDSSGTSSKGVVGGTGPVHQDTTGTCVGCIVKKDSIIIPLRVTWTPDPIKEPGLDAFFKKNIKYPEIAKERNIQGIVWLEFIVDVYGYTKEYKIVKSPDGLLSKEVMRVAPKMPKFEPVTFNGVPVEYIFRKPINFILGQ